MVLLSKIYTKGGDKGKTSLGNGARVMKNSLRLQAIGAVDELNAAVGLVETLDQGIQKILLSIQNDLFDVGGDLCFPEESKPEGALHVTQDYVARLEDWIDFYNKDLDALRSFVLPGGSRPSAGHHMARTIARRAEREVCGLLQEEEVTPSVMQYLNRLSDLFFVLARFENQQGRGDILWQPGGIAT